MIIIVRPKEEYTRNRNEQGKLSNSIKHMPQSIRATTHHIYIGIPLRLLFADIAKPNRTPHSFHDVVMNNNFHDYVQSMYKMIGFSMKYEMCLQMAVWESSININRDVGGAAATPHWTLITRFADGIISTLVTHQ